MSVSPKYYEYIPVNHPCVSIPSSWFLSLDLSIVHQLSMMTLWSCCSRVIVLCFSLFHVIIILVKALVCIFNQEWIQHWYWSWSSEFAICKRAVFFVSTSFFGSDLEIFLIRRGFGMGFVQRTLRSFQRRVSFRGWALISFWA